MVNAAPAALGKSRKCHRKSRPQRQAAGGFQEGRTGRILPPETINNKATGTAGAGRCKAGTCCHRRGMTGSGWRTNSGAIRHPPAADWRWHRRLQHRGRKRRGDTTSRPNGGDSPGESPDSRGGRASACLRAAHTGPGDRGARACGGGRGRAAHARRWRRRGPARTGPMPRWRRWRG